MTSCPSCAKFYLDRTIAYKATPLIPPYDKEDDIVQELLDYTQYLKAALDRECKGKMAQPSIEFFNIKRLTSTVKLPARRTLGAAGYDIFLDEEVHIPARMQALVKIGISLEFPQDYYARIAPRSGAALRLKLDIGVGVVDSDFMGEVHILILNHSDLMLSLEKGSCVAQIILEKIITPPIMESIGYIPAAGGSATARVSPTAASLFSRVPAIHRSIRSSEPLRGSLSQEFSFAAPARSLINRLYNMEIIFHIPSISDTKVQAILDTDATTCCICKDAMPKEAYEAINYKVVFFGINSPQETSMKLKNDMMTIRTHKFRIHFTYMLTMNLKDGIEMLLGCNFIKVVAGGLRIEGTEVTFYKDITTINTSPEVRTTAVALLEAEDTDPEFICLNEELFSISQVHYNTDFKMHFAPLMQRLKESGFIGDNPLQHWAKNKVICTLDIINPDLTIQDKPMKYITPLMEATFKAHIDILLKLGVIRPSKSRHRTTAFVVQSGTTMDLVTGLEKKGKERIVFNYKTLNDNTYKDQYSLLGINLIMKKIGHSRIFSKFDLKSGFHQVMMNPESVPWTAFLVPQGLYEWLVMPFGLKNAPAVFQRKMDNCFKNCEDFLVVYIDDILVFSPTEAFYVQHLTQMLDICQKEGLVLSPTKMKIAQPEIEFLGAIVGNRKKKLQQHIIKKIIDFDEEKLQTTKGLRS
ncbi:uncharacterized protein LOC141848283 [Curcuma longa]|uniref:uncharacterized protein LOC141848283 n=1 Tax=Curcuma longa TaxID=136217 RepID=UPI003D9E845D